MKAWQYIVCGDVYDVAKGGPDHGIASGTRVEDVPDHGSCPDCGVSKMDYGTAEIVAA